MTKLGRRRREDSENDPNLIDDSLTNLQWLTGVNLDDILTGKPAKRRMTEDSVGNDIPRRCLSSGCKESDAKPPYSYAALIIMAMKSTPANRMTLREIYDWIADSFPFYRHAEPTWKNSIRHNLSLNKCFVKIPRRKGEPGKGGYWCMESEHADKVLENNIRKRCSRMHEYDGDTIMRHIRRRQRQRLDVLQTMLDKTIITPDSNENFVGSEKDELSPAGSPEVPDSLDEMPATPLKCDGKVLANVEHCRLDHPYGKHQEDIYNESDEVNIRAIASNLIETALNVVSDGRKVDDEDAGILSNGDDIDGEAETSVDDIDINGTIDDLNVTASDMELHIDTDIDTDTDMDTTVDRIADTDLDTDVVDKEEPLTALPSMNSLLNSLANAHAANCMWSSDQQTSRSVDTRPPTIDQSSFLAVESMSKITRELLEARSNATSCHDTDGCDLAEKTDNEEFCEELDTIRDLQEEFGEVVEEDLKYLTVRGTKTTFFPFSTSSSSHENFPLNETRGLLAMVS